MAKTNINWADVVWNPTVGCTKVSSGCAMCYAEKFAVRLKAMGRPEYQSTVNDNGHWTGEITLLPERLEQPLHWRKPRRIFVNSMSDLFHEDVPDEFIWKVFDMISHNRRHTYMVLTKRPERMLKWFDEYKERFWHYPKPGKDMQYVKAPWPDPCIWLGVSVEDQATADERIPLLLQTPAVVRFVSVEPMLGPVDLSPYMADHSWEHGTPGGLNWVICGGESGPHARPMHPDWARSLRDQCQAVSPGPDGVAGVPFFFKQWGEWQLFAERDGPIYDRVGKKAAGRVLDGRTWDEWPDLTPGPFPKGKGE